MKTATILTVIGLFAASASPAFGDGATGAGREGENRDQGQNGDDGDQDTTYLSLVTGGYLGLLAASFGFESGAIFAEVGAGYVPAFVGGADVTSAHLIGGATFRPLASAPARLRVGGLVVYNPDDDFFLDLPAGYPRGYYPPTAIEPGLFVGLEADVGGRLSVTAAMTALTDDLIAHAANREELPLSKVSTLSFGLRRAIGE